jgi:hypothetical protein
MGCCKLGLEGANDPSLTHAGRTAQPYSPTCRPPARIAARSRYAEGQLAAAVLNDDNA